MMTHQHWMNQTKRHAFAPRGDKLKEIDRTLADYHQKIAAGGAGATPALKALFDAVIDWMKSKTNWKSSIRNSKIESGGKGTVETLLEEIFAKNPAYRAGAAPYLAPVASPPPPPIGHGAKVHQKDEDGGWHDIPIQREENSCGPCCIRMVIKLVRNKDEDEEYIRELVEAAEESKNFKGTLGGGGVVGRGGAHDWSASGGGTWLVPKALETYRPTISCTHTTNASDLLQSTKKKPAIGVVQWKGGGGGLHYVVVAGKSRTTGNLIILDPFNGVQSVPIAGNRPDEYQPLDPHSKAVVATADWYDWVCQVD